MDFLGYTEKKLKLAGAWHTASEIHQQPVLWAGIFEKLCSESEALMAFLDTAYRQCDNIVFTGAGTSAFIGLSLHGLFFKRTGILTRAIATTDIVTHPKHYFDKSKTSLIISFARSGNSPESCAALELADNYSKKCYHLIVTCARDGNLASYAGPNESHIFVLPEEANDKSLAMTSSYSGMLLAGILLANISDMDLCRSQVDILKACGQKMLDEYPPLLKEIANHNFKRAVFLGSAALFGTAVEAHLKLQELTYGNIICAADTYLGFRHGPKAIINEDTLIMYFLSNNDNVAKYERDLIHSMEKGNPALIEITIGGTHSTPAVDANFSCSIDGIHPNEDFLPVCGILPAQLLGFFKSIQLECRPDMPSANGAISRVVEGVNIYS